jgi:hypothetical protein
MIAYASITFVIAVVAGIITGLISGRGWCAFMVFVLACACFSLPPIIDHASKAKEIDATGYIALTNLRDEDPSLAPAIAKAAADGKVTVEEYQDIDRSYRLHALEDARADLIQTGKAASGRSLQTEGL